MERSAFKFYMSDDGDRDGYIAIDMPIYVKRQATREILHYHMRINLA